MHITDSDLHGLKENGGIPFRRTFHIMHPWLYALQFPCEAPFKSHTSASHTALRCCAQAGASSCLASQDLPRMMALICTALRSPKCQMRNRWMQPWIT